MALDFLYKEKVDYLEMSEQFKRLLPFPIEDAGRCKYITQVESMIIDRYFDCMNMIKNYENLGVLQQICENYTGSEKIRCARDYESSLLKIAWNNGERKEVAVKDVEFCKCAYEMAWYVGELGKMEFYDTWIKKHKDKVIE